MTSTTNIDNNVASAQRTLHKCNKIYEVFIDTLVWASPVLIFVIVLHKSMNGEY